ncbi:dihydropteroate synthase [Thalassococcus sp. CAU 1522]|uniref:Dihydropteroate synthase n=1 Tax=Thalassococcus arenae TaxID=2851652 RepID=A0ABS6N2N3_9RHOB|nr:dihydropteroate synthase [Thalassococcus arenae]MBV2358274.1 dihydropteroate synthase [Thalassococcus arenae]
MSVYFRPLVSFDPVMPRGAIRLAGGPGWFTHAVRLVRGVAPQTVRTSDIPTEIAERLSAPRPAIAGLSMERPRIMGILNVTPDSFSDGGLDSGPEQAARRGAAMVAAGADLVDIGGESTRPGAATVPEADEIARVAPVIAALAPRIAAPISIDTRKAEVARAAVAAGATLVNDVSGFTYDPALAPFCRETALPVCVMHAQGDPQTMQSDPRYDDVLLDVYDFLDGRIAALTAIGLPRDRIVIDPGIGFGKTLAHNLSLLNGLALFHGLGCPILLGASRKGFIGRLSGADPASARMPGSVAVALAAVAQGVQILRVHDVAETRQALTLWQAVQSGEADGT